MNSLKLSCRVDKCIIDYSLEMEIKKCTTQLDKSNPNTFNQCPNLIVEDFEEYRKGEGWNKFGAMIEKSKPKDRDKLE